MIPPIKIIFETEKIIKFLQKRNLESQYIKAKNNILRGNNSGILLKLMNPKNKGIYSFRINKQFRAFGTINNEGFLVVNEISNHQNF